MNRYSDKADTFFFKIWHEFYKEPTDNIPDYPITEIRKRYFNFDWYEIYDFIEFLIQINLNIIATSKFISSLNKILETEFSGYRILERQITPITSNLEIKELEEIHKIPINYPLFHGVDIHISEAIRKLSDRNTPDYRNSIKESISAIETICRQLTGESTLGKALSKMESNGIKINSELKKGIEKLYNYTNNKESGIRHSIIQEHIDPTFEEAKFMLVSCSAFINYIIGVSSKSNS